MQRALIFYFLCSLSLVLQEVVNSSDPVKFDPLQHVVELPQVNQAVYLLITNNASTVGLSY